MKVSESEEILLNLPIEGVLEKDSLASAAGETEEDCQPSLTDETSVDSALYESDSSLLSATSSSHKRNNKKSLKRRVSFQKIEVREYSLTVGDHPLCRDGLPLQLDWAHGPSTEINMICSRQRESKYQLPPRLSYEEKRNRLISTTDFRDQRDRNLALGQVIQSMQSWWDRHPILPMPNLYDIQEEEVGVSAKNNVANDCHRDDEQEHFFEIEPPKLEEYVMEWRRNKPRKSR